MSILATLVLAASTSTAVLPTCSWDRPGVNPFMGDVVGAVDRYQDIAKDTRAKLQARMKERQYDEIAVISRGAIEGKAKYKPEIRDMHFGQGQICRTVSRSRWGDEHRERGLVYCEAGECIIVPTVCRNVSRIKRLPNPIAGAALDEPLIVAVKPHEDAPLEFEAPGAGEVEPTSFASVTRPPGVPSMITGGNGGTPPAQPPGTFPPVPGFNPGPLPPVAPVPEPSTWAMFGLGLLVLGLRKRAQRAD